MPRRVAREEHRPYIARMILRGGRPWVAEIDTPWVAEIHTPLGR